MRALLFVAAVFASGAAVGAPALAQCPPTVLDPVWTDDFSTDGLDDEVFAVVAWDPDGPGPLPERLVVGGAFTGAGDVRAPLVAVLEDGVWAPLDPGVLPQTGYVVALAVADVDGDPGTPPSLFAAIWGDGVYENRGSG